MARKRKPLDVRGEADQVLVKLREHRKGSWQRERLRAVKLGLKGELGLEEIAERAGRARSVIQLWFDSYRKGGVAGLLTRRSGGGRKPRVCGEVAAELRDKLEEGCWRTAEEARRWLGEQHGIEIEGNYIYELLKKSGGRLKVPRPVHRKRNLDQGEAFKQELGERLESLDIPAGRRVRVWVQDEARYGLLTAVRRVWGLRGIRAVCRFQHRFDCAYVYGSVEVCGDGSQFTYLPRATKETTLIHLRQVAGSDPDAVHVFIWDGAGFHHRDGEEGLPGNVRLLALPPYSPELNPIEKLWDHMKDSICNRADDTLDDLEEAITVFLRGFWESPQRIRSLVGEGWMRDQVNAT